MKKLREGYTTGSCAAAAALGSVMWQKYGECPQKAEVETPSGRVLALDITPFAEFECGVIKDSGDDPDETNGCMVKASVHVCDFCGQVTFKAGEGVGTVTKKGLKIPPGEPAINPVPRQMIEKAVRSVTGELAAVVTVSVENGREIAARTFNPRLGIVGGISVLGTTGIVRPMSEEAVRESLAAELSVCREQYGTAAAFVTGYSGEKFLKKTYADCGGIVLCSNYLGFLLDEAAETGFTHVLVAGGPGKLVKPAADIMYLHSHTAGGQREVICTHAALAGADKKVIEELYKCTLTGEMTEILRKNGLEMSVMRSVADAAEKNCNARTGGKIRTGIIFTDEKNEILVCSGGTKEVLRHWRTGKWGE